MASVVQKAKNLLSRVHAQLDTTERRDVAEKCIECLGLLLPLLEKLADWTFFTYDQKSMKEQYKIAKGGLDLHVEGVCVCVCVAACSVCIC